MAKEMPGNLKGLGCAPQIESAFVKKTPAKKRKEFAKVLAGKKGK